MKRSYLLAAVAALAGTSAMAQSTVNVYGRLNVTLERQKIGTLKDSVVANNSSRIGFRGTEDLGGGLKAFFLIEHGFDPTTGVANAAFWGRESNVGLMGGFGKVRLGNMGPTAAYFTTADYISMHNHDTGSSSDAFYLYPGRGTNSVSYTTPSFGGGAIEVQVAEGDATAERTIVVAGNWVGGPLHIGATYLKGPVGMPVGFAADGKEFGLRGLYELGPVTLGAYFIRNEADAVAGFGDVKRDSYRFSAMYTLGASEFHLNVGTARKLKADVGGTLAATDANQYTLGYNYNLSKRTKVYGYVTKIANKAAASYGTGLVGADNDFSSIAAGIRHNF